MNQSSFSRIDSRRAKVATSHGNLGRGIPATTRKIKFGSPAGWLVRSERNLTRVIIMSHSFPSRPFTTETLAEHWSCSPQHVRDLIAEGALKSFRLGRLIRIPVAAVEEFERLASAAELEPEPEPPRATLSKPPKTTARTRPFII